MVSDDIRDILFLCALQNAVKHGSVPQSGAVIGMVMGAHPDLRGRAKEVSGLVKQAIAEVAAFSPEERVTKLQLLSPEMFASLHEKHEHRKTLPDLNGAEQGVVMRFAPNPSGPLHIGHARAAALNDAYVKQYGGRYILRIEDTDPKRVDPDAYEMVQKDIKWLGMGITETVTQSERLPLVLRSLQAAHCPWRCLCLYLRE